MDKTERKQLRRVVKKDGNRIGWSLVVYFVIDFIAAIAWLIGDLLISLSKVSGQEAKDAAFDDALDRFNASGVPLILGVLLGLGFLFLVFRKQDIYGRLFHREEKLKFPTFMGILCVFMGTQLFFQLFCVLMEAGLNAIGYTSELAMEMATGNSMSISMLLYAGIIGPIVEELVYRGIIMRSLEKYGTSLAIVVSSVFFGIMHGNIPQAIFAFLVGLILGYTASRYSIVWSTVLHIINNLVFGELFSHALMFLPENVQNIIFYALTGAFALIGIIVLIVKRKKISAYFKENKWEKPNMRWLLTCSGALVFFALNLWLGLSLIIKL